MPQNHNELRPHSAFEKAALFQLRQYQGYAEQSGAAHVPFHWGALLSLAISGPDIFSFPPD